MADNPLPEDDILENALNKGIKSAADKFSISTDDVKAIVRAFKYDIEDITPCQCRSVKSNTMCMFCTEGQGERINY